MTSPDLSLTMRKRVGISDEHTTLHHPPPPPLTVIIEMLVLMKNKKPQQTIKMLVFVILLLMKFNIIQCHFTLISYMKIYSITIY